MTTFNKLCGQMFRQKNKYVKLLLIIQAFVIVFFSAFFILDKNYHSGTELWATFVTVTIYSTVCLDIVFMILACYKNEKFNFSQTWRSIPVSNKQFFLANLLSTFYNCVVLFIPQVIVTLIFGALDSSIQLFDFKEWTATPFYDNKILLMLVTLIAIVLVIQTFVALVDFASYTLADFVSIKNSKIVRWALMVIFVIAGAYFAVKITGSIALYLYENDAVRSHFEANAIATVSAFLLPLEMLIGSIVFGGVDLWLINKYVEAKANK